MRLFNFREKVLVWGFILLIAGAFVYWLYSFYVFFTNEVPKQGGNYVEGIVGQPLYVNPILSQSSEADSSLVSLIFDGVARYGIHGEIEPDLAERWEVSEDGRIYTVYLRKGVRWHDGEEVLAEDVVFTYQLIQNPAYKSPLRQNWQGVEVAQIDDYTLTLTLKTAYFGFVQNLTVGILPRHVWQNVVAEKFPLSRYNLEPIGTGAYRYSQSQKDSDGNILSYELVSNSRHHLQSPYISMITVQFYPDRDSLIDAYKRKEVLGMNTVESERVDSLGDYKKSLILHAITIPHFFMVFFNQTKSVPLAYDEVRQALSLSMDRRALIDTVLHGYGTLPFHNFITGTLDGGGRDIRAHADIDQAKKILEAKGWKEGSDGIREKEGQRLEFDLMTSDWPEFTATADALQKQWRNIGAQMNVKVVTVYDLGQNYIRPRDYDALLFVHATNLDPDLYSYWHSSQKRDSGLNFSLFNNEQADSLLEKARETVNADERKKIYAQFAELLEQKVPAVYVFSPEYLYPVSNKVRGILVDRIATPADRFSHVEEWYMKTRRVLK